MDELENRTVYFRDSARFWVQHIFVPIVTVFGVAGNVTTIFLLKRKQLRISSTIYLTALAASDTMFLVFSFSMAWKHYDFMKSVGLYWNYIPFGLWITDALSSTSVWITVAFTIQRYLAVCQPLLVRASLSSTRPASVCAIVCILCFVSTSSTPFEWKVSVNLKNDFVSALGNETSHVTSGTDNRKIHSLESTTLGRSALYRLVYHLFTTVTFIMIPFIILAVGNILLIRTLHKSRRARNSLTNYCQYQKCCREERITVTLIGVIIVYLVCQKPTAVVLIYTSVHTPSPGSKEENVLLGLGNIFNLLVAVNAAVNFVPYTALSQKHRSVFTRIFCRHKGKHHCQIRSSPGIIFHIPNVENPPVPRTSRLIGDPGSINRSTASLAFVRFENSPRKCDVLSIPDTKHRLLMTTRWTTESPNCWDVVRFATEIYVKPRDKAGVDKECKSG